MNDFLKLKSFNPFPSTLTLWTFKGTAPDVNGHWVETTDDLDEELKQVFVSQLQNVTEELDYGLLAQNNEGSVLSIPADETHLETILNAVAQATSARRTRDIKTLKNAKFYVVRMVHDGKVVTAVRKTDSSWKTKAALSVLTAVYKDKELDVVEDEGFRLHRTFDFFCIGDNIFVSDKRNFESVLNYKAAHEDDFVSLQAEPKFSGIFSDLTELISYVGTNKIQLRRISAIKVKAFYQNANFMKNLRARYAEFGLNLNFDAAGKIVPTPETCRDIMTALLDLRLRSGFSGNTYDVPDAVKV